MPIAVEAIDHLVLNVADVERSAAWYASAIGARRDDFDPGAGKPRRTALKIGRQKINLRPVDADPVDWFTAQAPTAGSDDLCFLTASPPDAVVAHLAALDIAVEVGPVARQGAQGPLASVYCRDPDGNLIEIASYPDR